MSIISIYFHFFPGNLEITVAKFPDLSMFSIAYIIYNTRKVIQMVIPTLQTSRNLTKELITL